MCELLFMFLITDVDSLLHQLQTDMDCQTSHFTNRTDLYLKK